MPSFSAFLATLSSLNKDYTAKAASHIGSYRVHIAKSAQERGGDQATLERALGALLEQVDLQVRMAGEGFDRTASEVAQRMDEVGNRLDAVRKKVSSFFDRLPSKAGSDSSRYQCAEQGIRSEREREAIRRSRSLLCSTTNSTRNS